MPLITLAVVIPMGLGGTPIAIFFPGMIPAGVSDSIAFAEIPIVMTPISILLTIDDALMVDRGYAFAIDVLTDLV